MKKILLLIALGLTSLPTLTCFGATATQVPIEDFAKSSLTQEMYLSPDGERICYLQEVDETYTPFILNLADMSRARLSNDAGNDIYGVEWIGPKRILYQSGDGTMAIDADNKHYRAITGFAADPEHYEGVVHAYDVIHIFDDPDKSLLMLELNDRIGSEKYLHIIKVSSIKGKPKRIVENPGDVIDWGIDHLGNVRFGMTLKGVKNEVIYRKNDDEPWHKLEKLGSDKGRLLPLMFDGENKKLLVSAPGANGVRALHWLDPETQTLGEAILRDPVYDIAPIDVVGQVSAGIYYSKLKKAVIGVSYVTEGPRTVWLDPEFAAIQAGLDKAIPNHINTITGRSDDEQHLVILSRSDRDPGTYFLYDRKTRKLTALGRLAPWINPEQMAEVHPIKYKARDGLLIHGYLTLPVGVPPKDLPLVVMPHGGPWVRDVWSYDPLVQMLANRGYAVLQMNYRGSTGYGDDFRDKSHQEIGHAIQTDIDDGTLWATAQGIADPKRVAIVGASYGGYSTFYALGKSPALYKCGIAMAGVSDMQHILDEYDELNNREGRIVWEDQLGDAVKNPEMLREISPVNFADKIVAPLLITHGKDDTTVPPKQSKLMINALKEAGHPPEVFFMADTAHSYGRHKQKIELFKRIEQFLATHL